MEAYIGAVIFLILCLLYVYYLKNEDKFIHSKHKKKPAH
jgi:preprotein translocase subunit SecG